jgi:hypothetical protein
MNHSQHSKQLTSQQDAGTLVGQDVQLYGLQTSTNASGAEAMLPVGKTRRVMMQQALGPCKMLKNQAVLLSLAWAPMQQQGSKHSPLCL